MPLSEIMRDIEDHSFSAEVNLAAGTKTFRRMLRAHALFGHLREAARDVDARAAIARRVEELAESAIDERYESRYDVALSAYLTVLGDTAQPEIIAKAAAAAAQAPNTWWTVSISRELMAHAVAKGQAMAPSAARHVIPETLARNVQSELLMSRKLG